MSRGGLAGLRDVDLLARRKGLSAEMELLVRANPWPKRKVKNAWRRLNAIEQELTRRGYSRTPEQDLEVQHWVAATALGF